MNAFTITTNHYEHKLLVFTAHEKEYAVIQAKAWLNHWLPGTKVKSARKWRDGDWVKGNYRMVQLPFEGFNSSTFEDMLDHAHTQEIENWDEREKERGEPKELQIDYDEYRTILDRHVDWDKGREAIFKDYPDCFNTTASEWFELPDMGLTYAAHTIGSRWSREYTVSAWIHPIVVQWLVMRATISEYDSLHEDIYDYTDEDLGDLLTHCIEDGGDTHMRDFNWNVYYKFTDDGCDQQYFGEHCVDWPKVEADIGELRDEKAHKYDNEDGVPRRAAPLPRCEITQDMFPGPCWP